MKSAIKKKVNVLTDSEEFDGANFNPFGPWSENFYAFYSEY